MSAPPNTPAAPDWARDTPRWAVEIVIGHDWYGRDEDGQWYDGYRRLPLYYAPVLDALTTARAVADAATAALDAERRASAVLAAEVKRLSLEAQRDRATCTDPFGGPLVDGIADDRPRARRHA